MSASLHLCTSDDIERLAPMVAANHAVYGIKHSDAERHACLTELLSGTPHGVAYLIGPRRSPVGYITVSFGFSAKTGGINGTIDEFFIRENVRGRGMGSEVLQSLLPALGDSGVKALRLELTPEDRPERKLYARAGFRLREGAYVLARVF